MMYAKTASPLATKLDVLAGFVGVAHDSWEMLGDEELFRRHVCDVEVSIPFFWEDLLYKLSGEEGAIRQLWKQAQVEAKTTGL